MNRTDRADELQVKMSVAIQLIFIITFTIVDSIHIIHRFLFIKEISVSLFVFPALNILLFVSYYLTLKVRRMTGEHTFFTILALALFSNIFLNHNEYVNNQVIYLIPIILTLILSDSMFTILYSIIIIFIFTLDQIHHKQFVSVNSISIYIHVILAIIIVVVYDIWFKESKNIKLKLISDYYSSTLKVLGRVAELKDEETHEHLERVSIIVELIANRLKRNPQYSQYLTTSYIEDLKAASALHDIGKIGIDDRILLKEGKLTEEEFEKIKRHTEYGAELLCEAQMRSNNNLYSLAIDLAKHHHERWDGRGYPDKLKGRNIPLSARIMSIADVYDALVSKRPYKKAYSEREAFAIVVSESGAQFDPDLVRIFMKIHKKIYSGIEHLL